MNSYLSQEHMCENERNVLSCYILQPLNIQHKLEIKNKVVVVVGVFVVVGVVFVVVVMMIHF